MYTIEATKELCPDGKFSNLAPLNIEWIMISICHARAPHRKMLDNTAPIIHEDT